MIRHLHNALLSVNVRTNLFRVCATDSNLIVIYKTIIYPVPNLDSYFSNLKKGPNKMISKNNSQK